MRQCPDRQTQLPAFGKIYAAGPGPMRHFHTGPPALLEIYTRATMDLVSAHQNGNYKICKT